MIELFPRRHDEDLAIFIRQINLAVRSNRRGAESAAHDRQTLAVNLLACLEIVGVEGAVIGEHVKNAVIDQRRRHVRTATGATPCDCVAAGLSFRQSEIAARACFDDEDRPLWSTTTHNDEHVVGENWCRRSYL